MLRTILAVLFAVCYLILGIPVLFVEWLIGKKNPHLRDISSLRMVQWAFRVIYRICGVKLTIIGQENVPKDTPVLYVANHNSYFDIIITYALCENLTGYIAKDSLEKVPLLNIWMKRRKWSVFVLFSAIFICLVSTGIGGCGWKKTGVEKLRDLDYTVVGEAELPEELKTEIEARKAEDFKMTYLLDDALYIVHGFGMQETGGYSIQVQALYLAENAIYFETDLIGPENGAKVEKCVSYPYIVVKTERLTENVVFE